MSNQERIYKLCFYCEHPIIENDRLSIGSITHAGLKYNISKRHREKIASITNSAAYESDLMHLHCYDSVASELGFGNGMY